MKSAGTVYLVGAGPGDEGLLTVRGAQLLGRADVVVYDALVNPELLRLAPQSAEVIFAGKRSRDHAIPQEALNELLITKAREGKVVVRLKGGDPYVFGRGGEEAEDLAAAGLEFEVVPGISSVIAAPNYAGIPLTHRKHCSSFTVLTGHEDPSKSSSSLDWRAVAAMPGTKVVLMGAERIGEIADALMKEGMPAPTPVAMIRWGTTARQQTVTGTLGTIAAVAASGGVTSPAVAVIGDVVGMRPALNWFERRPLFGRRVVVTRTRQQAGQLSGRLRELGAEVLEVPTIRIEQPRNRQALVEALAGLGAYDWLVFTSANGVDAFFEHFFKAFTDLRDLGSVRIAAVGPSTAAKIKDLHLAVDAMPDEYQAGRITEALAACQSLENLRILLLRAEVANAELPKALEDKGAIVDDIACYRNVPDEEAKDLGASLEEQGADWLTFTSSSTVRNFHACFDLKRFMQKFPDARIASIGPETSRAVEGLGFKPDVEADPHTLDGLTLALRRAVEQDRVKRPRAEQRGGSRRGIRRPESA